MYANDPMKKSTDPRSNGAMPDPSMIAASREDDAYGEGGMGETEGKPCGGILPSGCKNKKESKVGGAASRLGGKLKAFFKPKRRPPPEDQPVVDDYTFFSEEPVSSTEDEAESWPTDDLPPQEDYTNSPCHDSFFTSKQVFGLNGQNFTTFLRRKDATMVMFYNDCAPDVQKFQTMVSEAADTTKRANHAFASVDCSANRHLCQLNGVATMPALRLYSKDYTLGEITCIHTISPDVLRQYVEMAPLPNDNRMVKFMRSQDDLM